jgi:hypothetical protein
VIAILLVYGFAAFVLVVAMMNEGRVHSWFYGYAPAGELGSDLFCGPTLSHVYLCIIWHRLACFKAPQG